MSDVPHSLAADATPAQCRLAQSVFAAALAEVGYGSDIGDDNAWAEFGVPIEVLAKARKIAYEAAGIDYETRPFDPLRDETPRRQVLAALERAKENHRP